MIKCLANTGSLECTSHMKVLFFSAQCGETVTQEMSQKGSIPFKMAGKFIEEQEYMQNRVIPSALFTPAVLKHTQISNP